MIVQAPAVSRPIAGGMAGPGLLAHVLVAKYADHRPPYRQSGIYASEGVDLERSTRGDWVGQCAALLGRKRPAAPPCRIVTYGLSGRSGKSSSIRLLGQTGNFSRVSLSQACGSSPFSLAVPNRL